MKYHGRVVPLYGTGWDRLDWDRLHRGCRTCPTTWTGIQRGCKTCPLDRDSLQRGCMTSPWDRAQVSFDLSLSQWERFGTGSVPVPCACTKPVPLGQSLCLYQTCPTWIDTLSVQPFQNRHLTNSRVFPDQKPRGVQFEFPKFPIKNLSQIGSTWICWLFIPSPTW